METPEQPLNITQRRESGPIIPSSEELSPIKQVTINSDSSSDISNLSPVPRNRLHSRETILPNRSQEELELDLSFLELIGQRDLDPVVCSDI